jgi:hypothetical protein
MMFYEKIQLTKTKPEMHTVAHDCNLTHWRSRDGNVTVRGQTRQKC